MVHVGEGACSAWHMEVAVRAGAGSRKRRREEEGEGKKGEKEKERREKEEKETSAGFAATVASRAWRRREAAHTRNEEIGEVLNDD